MEDYISKGTREKSLWLILDINLLKRCIGYY